MGSLRECANSVKFNVQSNWNTQDLGRKLCQAFGDGKMATIGEYTITRSDNGHIDSFRVFGNTIRVLMEIGGQVGFPYRTGWNTRHYGNKLVDFINGDLKDDTVDEITKEEQGLMISPDMTTYELFDAFSAMFGGHLRIKKGAARCDKRKGSEGINCKLSEIGLKKEDIYSGDLTVGEFTKKAKENGLSVVVATNDDWVSVLDDFTLDFVGQIPNSTTFEKMEAILNR